MNEFIEYSNVPGMGPLAEASKMKLIDNSLHLPVDY